MPRQLNLNCEGNRSMSIFADWISRNFTRTAEPVAVIESIPKLADAIGAVCHASVNSEDWADAISPFMVSSGITTPHRIAAFLGQLAVESAGFSVMSENLNYSAEGLRATFPTHFSGADAASYTRQPEKIANRAYCNRLGNGNEASGDGWRYRGAGLIQLTGKDSQTKFAATCAVSGDVGDYLRTARGAAQSACWYWATNNLNAFADGWQITEISHRVNGGSAGLSDRINLSNKALAALA